MQPSFPATKPGWGVGDRMAYVESAHDCTDCNLAAMVPQHAMKPYRVLATSELVKALGLHNHFRTVSPPHLELEDLQRVHSVDYLHNLSLYNTKSWCWGPDVSRIPYSGDCPPVEGIVEHSLSIAAGSLMGAVLLNSGAVDVAVHWGGGMHHTKCGECSGFCYINDIVLAIVELLKAHDRVLYIDLDMHHGDGVDEAFCTTNRVFTLSLHKFGESFFPGTGHPRDIGMGKGRYFSMNLALWEGIDDFMYTRIFQHALQSVTEKFRPNAIVLQCGADSLAGDRLGLFNISSQGLGKCVELVKELGCPMLVVGGGGYTIRNVAKLWAYETSVLCGNPLPVNTKVPVEQMPLTGWLFEDASVLLVPSDVSNGPLPGFSIHRAHQALREQIDRHCEHIYAPTQA